MMLRLRMLMQSIKKIALVSIVSVFMQHSIGIGMVPLKYWEPFDGAGSNFGDEMAKDIVQRMIERCSGKRYKKSIIRKAENHEPGLLAIGSILQFAVNGDLVWGSGINGKCLHPRMYSFTHLQVRAVRGPCTRRYLEARGIFVPEVYGDPALLLPILFPEFQKEMKIQKKKKYVLVPHISEEDLFKGNRNAIMPTLPWKTVVKKILQSEFVISSSLHGIIVAEAFGIPARLLRITENEPYFKYYDYYLGTGRTEFTYARSVQEALKMGGEAPINWDPNPLLEAFPYEQLQRMCTF